MKPAFAIALLIRGIVLICVPPASDFQLSYEALHDQQATADSSSRASFELHFGVLRGPYRAGCFFMGAAMIVVAVAGSWGKRDRTGDTPPENPATR